MFLRVNGLSGTIARFRPLKIDSTEYICLRRLMLKLPRNFDYFGDEKRSIRWRAMRGRNDHCRELPMHRCAGLAQAWLSSIAAAVLMGLEAGWKAGGVDQCRDGTTTRNLEIPKSPVRWRLG